MNHFGATKTTVYHFSTEQWEVWSVSTYYDSYLICENEFICTCCRQEWISAPEAPGFSRSSALAPLCFGFIFVTVLITCLLSLCRASAGRAIRGEEEDGCSSVQSELTDRERSLHCPGKCNRSVKTPKVNRNLYYWVFHYFIVIMSNFHTWKIIILVI